MSKFIIFAHPRSGSTSLARVLAESPDVSMAIEPFHPGFSKWNPLERDYSQYIRDPKTMDQALDEIFKKYTAIKVLDYQFPEKIYFSMLKRNDLKVLFLRRKNLLAAALSNAIGEQTGQWHKQDDFSIYDHLQPVDITRIEAWIRHIRKLHDDYYQFLQKHRKGDYVLLEYESLFSPVLDENRLNLGKICKFLDISLPPETAIAKYMLPVNARINIDNVYSKIPNYEDIKKKFGEI